MVRNWTHQKERFFSLYYSGTIDQTGQAGTGFIILVIIINLVKNNVIGFEAISERLCKINTTT
jgi:hypothetical protein